ncbi:PDZ domain-containing protein [Tumebacillus sp. ITR2]|uniref:PDZ domain-containing protein n=1 Tax=Tumebacillus amylolyticus TaxID=2801339 RepID=A0ABS1J5G8_9BACL|nr:S41 family peptidase [Tumebacillus amylolyticus]MBL0385477.1 PDZ domain-containing protein [Tumebacillus amylolyticus]
MRWKTKWTMTVLAGALLLSPVSSASAAVDPKNLDTLTKIYSLLVDDHFTHPDQEKLLKAAVSGMLNELNDPFTNYFTPQEYQQFVDAIQQAYAGIGVLLEHSDDGQALVVKEVYAGTPAEQGGLQVGDRIVQVGDTAAAPSTLDQLADLLRGLPNTTVTFRIVRGTEAPKSVTLTREAIELPMVAQKDLGNGTGYIRIYSFGDRTTQEYAKALSDLQEKGAKRLVLDLRGNGGGLVKSALEIADSLLTKGIILQMHEDGNIVSFDADAAGDDQLPVTVLIDRHSASASEILAGALQKNGRAKLVGETSYGKGTMQEPVELPNGGYIKVSIDQWMLADGTTPDHVGLTPDVRMTRPESFLNAALGVLEPDHEQSVVFDSKDNTIPAPLTLDGQVYLPLRYTVEMLGAPVTWVAEQDQVTFTLQGHQATVRLADGVVTVDGTQLSGHPLRVIDGTSYLSVDALKWMKVKVDSTENTVKIQTH